MSRKTNYKPTNSSATPPSNWTATRPHKYCGRMDAASPREGKANKTHHCEDCAIIKARVDRIDTKLTKSRREDKMNWVSGGDDW
jgi:hypothetical protein